MSTSLARLNRPISSVWAIPLSDSAHKHWLEKSDESSVLVYHRENMLFDGSETKEITAIRIAKDHPKLEIAEIQKTAEEIYDFKKVKQADCIFGVEGNSLVKVGFVQAKSNNNTFGLVNLREEIHIEVEWVKLIDSPEFKKQIFDPTHEIKKLAPKELTYIERQVGDQLIAAYERLPFPIEEIASEAYNSYESVGKTFINKEILDVPVGKKLINLFYGTNRNNTGSEKFHNRYGKIGGELVTGKCVVSLPEVHEKGELEKPPEIFYIPIGPDDPEIEFAIDSLEELSYGDFKDIMRRDLESIPDKSALIFIHGFNMTFTDAAKRSAQITNDIPFKGLSGFFSWPAGGRLVSYGADIERAESSIRAFSQFVNELILNSGVEKLHIIAHSMGNRVLTGALNLLGSKAELADKLQRIHQIVLAAPDIDQEVFEQNILPVFKNIGKKRTLYSSDKDKPLGVSEFIREGRPRLGQAGKDIFVADGLDTVEASYIKTKSSHGYMFEATELLFDLYYLLNLGVEPQFRRLRPFSKNDMNFWLFV
jgi:esterase/lipase superfamily enzyme